MKNKQHVGLIVFLSFLFIILYVFLSAKPLAKEYQFIPQWTISTSNPTVKDISSIKDEKLYFHLGQTIGYFTKNGDLTLFKTFPGKVSISDNYYSIYETDSSNIEFFNCDNTLTGKIDINGFPYFVDNNIYVFIPGGASFAKCKTSGELNWTYEGTLPITAFAANQNFTTAGFADGSITVLNNSDGAVVSSYEPGGSDYPVILGLDISPDSKYVASISGRNPQRFVLSECNENQHKVIYHKFLESDSPYRTAVYFTKDSNRVLYDTKSNLGLYDISKNKNYTFPIKDRVISFKENNNFIYILTNNKNTYTVYLIGNSNVLEGSFSFQANTAFIHTDDEHLYIGKDTSISCMLIDRE